MSRVATRVAACLIVASFALTSGCSVLFVRPAKRKGPGRYEPAGCTTGRTAPTVDVFLAAIQFFGTFIAFAKSDVAYQGATASRRTDIGAGLLVTTLFAGSAWYGFSASGTCLEAKRQLAAEQADDDEP